MDRRGSEPETVSHVNEVRLVGRLSAFPDVLELPSGDLASVFRLVVVRPPARRGSPVRATQDTLECRALAAGVRRGLARCAPGDVLEVHGRVERRFSRTQKGVSSYGIAVSAVARVASAGP